MTMILLCPPQAAMGNDNAIVDSGSLMRPLSASECLDMDCRCFSIPAVKKIKNIYTEYKFCRTELRLSRDWIKKHNDTDFNKLNWYQHEYAMVGGIVLAFSLGSLLTLVLK